MRDWRRAVQRRSLFLLQSGYRVPLAYQVLAEVDELAVDPVFAEELLEFRNVRHIGGSQEDDLVAVDSDRGTCLHNDPPAE